MGESPRLCGDVSCQVFVTSDHYCGHDIFVYAKDFMKISFQNDDEMVKCPHLLLIFKISHEIYSWIPNTSLNILVEII